MALAALPHPSTFALSERQDMMEKKSCHFSENPGWAWLSWLLRSCLSKFWVGDCWQSLHGCWSDWSTVHHKMDLARAAHFKLFAVWFVWNVPLYRKRLLWSLIRWRMPEMLFTMLVLPSHCLIEVGAEKSNLLVFKGPFKYVNTTEWKRFANYTLKFLTQSHLVKDHR